MSVPSAMADLPCVLSGAEGELVSLRIVIDPRRLEELLESLAAVEFPINPRIIHGLPTSVEFPAYRSRVVEVESAVASAGFPAGSVSMRSMIDEITSLSG